MFDGHALRLYKPAGTTDRGEDDYLWYSREAAGHNRLDRRVVGNVAQIDRQMCHIFPCASSFREENPDVFKHTVCLGSYVARSDDEAFVVDACRAGDVDMAAVTVVYGGSTFKSYAIFVGRIQVGPAIEKSDLTFTDGGIGKGIEGYQTRRVG